jgi:hypothetical protein
MSLLPMILFIKVQHAVAILLCTSAYEPTCRDVDCHHTLQSYGSCIIGAVTVLSARLKVNSMAVLCTALYTYLEYTPFHPRMHLSSQIVQLKTFHTHSLSKGMLLISKQEIIYSTVRNTVVNYW